MTEQKFTEKATELIKRTVDAISEKEYTKIASFAQINSSWVEAGQTQEEAFAAFGEWLDEQLAMWEEEEEIPFVVDPFSQVSLGNIELEDTASFVTYVPTNSGEEMDFWFEFDFNIESDERITVTFNVNY